MTLLNIYTISGTLKIDCDKKTPIQELKNRIGQKLNLDSYYTICLFSSFNQILPFSRVEQIEKDKIFALTKPPEKFTLFSKNQNCILQENSMICSINQGVSHFQWSLKSDYVFLPYDYYEITLKTMYYECIQIGLCSSQNNIHCIIEKLYTIGNCDEEGNQKQRDATCCVAIRVGGK